MVLNSTDAFASNIKAFILKGQYNFLLLHNLYLHMIFLSCVSSPDHVFNLTYSMEC